LRVAVHLANADYIRPTHRGGSNCAMKVCSTSGCNDASDEEHTRHNGIWDELLQYIQHSCNGRPGLKSGVCSTTDLLQSLLVNTSI